jgi:hypothetical protein
MAHNMAISSALSLASYLFFDSFVYYLGGYITDWPRIEDGD